MGLYLLLGSNLMCCSSNGMMVTEAATWMWANQAKNRVCYAPLKEILESTKLAKMALKPPKGVF